MTRAILTCFHKYQPYSGEFYQPIFDFFIKNLSQYKDEYDQLYLIDSNWNIPESDKYKVIKVSPHLRYYDAYKEVLPQIKEDLVLFLDNDMVIYREGIIRGAFLKLESSINNSDTYDVVSIYDSCGNYKTDKLNGKNKFCPYLFATRKDLLMKYREIDWGSNMPEHETLGKLTEKMLDDGIKPCEKEEDKNSIYFDGTQDEGKSKDLGYYHIRAGSTPAYLLTEKKYGNKQTYFDYLKNQPKREYLRQFAWYVYMLEKTNNYKGNIGETICYLLTEDLQIPTGHWSYYIELFKKYHGL